MKNYNPKSKIETLRHSLAHILAAAIQEMYPGVKFGIGPAIEQGFYYDFDFDGNSKIKSPRRRTFGSLRGKQKSKQEFKLTSDDLPKIEKRMREIVKQNLEFRIKNSEFKEAEELFKKQPYKLELIKDLKKEGNKKVSTYQVGDFIDLCKGPHIKSTQKINPDVFKLTKIAGAYWKGDEKKPMLTRIYGVAFETKKELNDYLKLQEEAEKRDHRLLGQKLELFLFDEEVGSGLPLWTPKGTILRKIIEDYLYQELKKEDYLWLATPHIGKLQLWQTSGHWDLYRENMYSPIKIDKEEYMLKPMNCPFHVKIYKSKIRSYKDLPLKFAELGTVYRYERSGVLHGLTRVRGFTQDDAHIFCSAEQLSNELTKLLKHGLKILKTFGFKDYDIYLSTRPEKFAGTEKDWKKAENVLKYVLKKLKLKYQIDSGGGVFYGPKIDIKIKDNLQREWQCTTIQVDFNLPEKFELNYINNNGEKERPYMLHRALLGSLERFIGVLLEHYVGALPFWLMPEQIWIIPISDKHKEYANKINLQLTIPKDTGLNLRTGATGQDCNLRTKIKDENETISKKIREGELQKIPYLLIIGDKEVKSKSVSVRQRGKGDLGMMKLTKFLKEIIGLGPSLIA